MFDGQITLNVITGLPATLVLLAGLRGLVPHLSRPTYDAAFHMAFAFILLMAGGAGRTGYWDLLRVSLTVDQWNDLRTMFGGIKANAFWNMILLWGGLHLLKLLHLSLPVGDRARFSMWTAWNYPVHFADVMNRFRLTRNKKDN